MFETTDFTIAGMNYKASKIPAMLQLKIMKRLTGVVASLQGAAKVAKALPEGEAAKADDQDEGANLLAMIDPIATAVGNLSDDDFTFICDACLSRVQREVQPGMWGPVWSPSSKSPLDEDMSAAVILQIVVQTLIGAFKGFFPAGLFASAVGGPATVSRP